MKLCIVEDENLNFLDLKKTILQRRFLLYILSCMTSRGGPLGKKVNISSYKINVYHRRVDIGRDLRRSSTDVN